jgi:hypothetical protein
MAVMTIFGLLSFQRFHPFVQHVNLPFQIMGVLLQALNSLAGFCEGCAEHLFFVLELLYLSVFLVGQFPPGSHLRLELFPFFCLRHAAPVAGLPLILQRHSPSE